MLRRHPFLSPLTMAYLIFVGWVTLNPEPDDPRAFGPLDRLLLFFSRDDRTSWITFDLVEFAANIAMFVPVGVFLVLLFGRRWWWIVTLGGLGLSVGIELIQIVLPSRFPDPRDVFANGMGTLLGALLGLALTAGTAKRLRLTAENAQLRRENEALRG
ncbi:VanZ family protein [Salinibacterium sp. ZJ450]|uniref:VanZ family protein n=1 Tax=Salinibacterium sp. ZJ450 TaxID=2708338 RepID=UPI001421A105|nr:VanZ family protein [Salinibacterium sp. ZJ450]